MSSSFRTKLCTGQWETAITVKIFINVLSDHDTQLLILHNGQKKEKECHTYIKRQINNNTIADFQLKLSHETWEPVFDGNDVTKIFNSFLNIFLRIFYSNFPLILAKNKMNQNSWITPRILTSYKYKTELYKELQNNNNATLTSYYRDYSKILSMVIYLLTYLLHGAESLLKSSLVLQLVKKFPAFLEPEGSSPYPQAPATCPSPEPTPSSPHHPLPLPEDPS